jgi:CRISPR-associated endoribonuclease Cas6
LKILLNLNSLQGGEIRLPRVNLHILQGFVYNLMSSNLAKFLHDEGYKIDGRKFKLFSFSWLMGKKVFDDKYVVFQDGASLVISSSLSSISQDVLNEVLQKEYLRLAGNEVFCSSVNVYTELVVEEEISIRTLSPICCYSTMYKTDGRPYTVYHAPSEQDFQRQIHNNLLKKYKLIYSERAVPEGKVTLEPLSRPRLQTALFKPDDPRPIKGWWGDFVLKGPKELLSVALDAGIGVKNSAGWGCVTLFERKGRNKHGLPRSGI